MTISSVSQTGIGAAAFVISHQVLATAICFAMGVAQCQAVGETGAAWPATVGGCRICVARRRVPQSLANTNTFATFFTFFGCWAAFKAPTRNVQKFTIISMIMGPHPVRSAPPSQGLRRPLSLSLSLSLFLPIPAYLFPSPAAPAGAPAFFSSPA